MLKVNIYCLFEKFYRNNEKIYKFINYNKANSNNNNIFHNRCILHIKYNVKFISYKKYTN